MNTRSKHNVYVFVALIWAFLSPPLVRAAVPDIDINYNVKDALRMDPRVNGVRDYCDDRQWNRHPLRHCRQPGGEDLRGRRSQEDQRCRGRD